MKQIGKWSSLLLCAVIWMSSAGCGGFTEINANSGAEDSGSHPSTLPTTTMPVLSTTTTETTQAVLENPTVHMIAVGDNLVQTAVYRAAQKWSADGTYDFTKTYENVAPLVQAADVAVVNQETLICGGDYEVSGSNFNFNSPVELGDEMVKIGFDVFTLANNHCLDKRVDGLSSSLDYWDGMMEQHPILAVGVYRDAADQERIRVQEVNGMKIAYLAYTEHLNGYSIPADSSIKIGMTDDTALIEKQIKEAKEIADAVVVSAHWGNEDTHTVAERVYTLADQMIQWGADVVLGGHSHTAQTMEYIDRPDGSRGFVFYSLGNFVSAQTDNFNLIGEMADFNLTLDLTTGELLVENVQCIPIITHYDDGKLSNLRLYPYSMYTEALANSHGVPYSPLGTAKTFGMDVINRIVNANIPEAFQKLD